MPLVDEVPREFYKIEVQYILKTGERVWWPGTILSSRELDEPGTVKVTASIEFAAYRKMPRSVEDLYFLAHRSVCTETGDTPWRTSAEAADAGAGDGDEAGYGRFGPRARWCSVHLMARVRTTLAMAEVQGVMKKRTGPAREERPATWKTSRTAMRAQAEMRNDMVDGELTGRRRARKHLIRWHVACCNSRRTCQRSVTARLRTRPSWMGHERSGRRAS